MELRRFENAEDFYKRVEPFLLEREAVHNLTLGIAATLINDPERYTDLNYTALVEEDGKVVAVALRTPPHNIQVSLTDRPEALALVAEDALAVYGSLPGVIGPADMSKTFAEQWRNVSGQPGKRGMTMQIYRLDAVNPAEGVSGRLRQATRDDRDLLLEWVPAFHIDALGEAPNPDEVKSAVESYIKAENRAMYLWEDGKTASMAANVGPTPNGCRVSMVYTPPELRRKGYASACVAALSQLMLDDGRKFCFLFADQKNPTSNHIYQEIGYRPVCDMNEYLFEETGERG